MVAIVVTSCLDRIPWILILGFVGAGCPSFLSCQKGSERTLEKGRGKRPGPSYSCGAIRSSLRGVIAPPAFGLRGRCGGGVFGGWLGFVMVVVMLVGDTFFLRFGGGY